MAFPGREAPGHLEVCMRHLALIVPLLGLASLGAFAPRPAAASAAEDLTAATAAGQPVYVVVTDGSARGTETVIAAANEAATTVNGKVLVLDRGVAVNADLVLKYRLGSAPVPLTLVLASNGLPVAGLTADKVTSAALVAALPSPKKLETLTALNDRRAVFVVVSGEKMTGRTAAIEQASLAMQAMELTKSKARMVLLDVADPKELAYVAELNLGPLVAPTVVVLSAAGKRIATLRAPWAAKDLAAAAVKEGCGCGDGNCGHGHE